MIGKIDKSGVLWIERAGKLQRCGCFNNAETPCQDWCPLFGEPEYVWNMPEWAEKELSNYVEIHTDETATAYPKVEFCSLLFGTHLWDAKNNPLTYTEFLDNLNNRFRKLVSASITICYKTLTFTEFTDERE